MLVLCKRERERERERERGKRNEKKEVGMIQGKIILFWSPASNKGGHLEVGAGGSHVHSWPAVRWGAVRLSPLKSISLRKGCLKMIISSFLIFRPALFCDKIVEQDFVKFIYIYFFVSIIFTIISVFK